MAESDLEKGAEFTQIFNKHGGEEDPVIAAQRFLNIFRQLHIFTAAKRKEFDELLLKQPASVKGMFASLPGGFVLQEYVNNLEQNAGMEKTQATVVANTPEISDEISKAKILASALAEAQSQIRPQAAPAANMQEIDNVASQLRREMNNLKRDVEEIKDAQGIDLSKLPAETLNKIQQSIERKIGSGNAALSGPLKIVADESLKEDLVQIITQALKTNAEAQHAGNRELAEIIGESQKKVAEMLSASNSKVVEMSMAAVTSVDSEGKGSVMPSTEMLKEMSSFQSDKLENVLATVLKESNMNSTQMIIDVLQTFQQENMKILEMQTELQKALLDVSKSIQMSGCKTINDDLNLESLDSDLENGVPAPVLLPGQDAPIPASQPQSEEAPLEEQPQAAAPADLEEIKEDAPTDEENEPEDDGVLTADDLFADIDGDEKKAAAEKEETIKKKKKKKKKNKNKSEDNAFRQETPQPTAPQQDSGVLQPSAEQVSQPQDIPFSSLSQQQVQQPAVNPVFSQMQPVSQPMPSGFQRAATTPFQSKASNPLFSSPIMSIPDDIQDQQDDDFGWGFTPASASQTVQPMPVDNTAFASYPPQEQDIPVDTYMPESTNEAEYYNETASADGQEWTWEYVEDDGSSEDGQEWEWEYVEDDSQQADNSGYAEESTFDTYAEDTIQDFAPETSQDFSETFYEENIPAEDIAAGEKLPPSAVVSNTEEAAQTTTGEAESNDDISTADSVRAEPLQIQKIPADNNNEEFNIAKAREASPTSQNVAAPFAEIGGINKLQKEDMPEFKISGLSSAADDDPFAMPS